MKAEQVFVMLLGIVGVALVTTVVMRPNSATVIRETGKAFAGSLRAAMNK